MKRIFYSLSLLLITSTLSLAQQVSLLKDINNSANNYGSYPNEITVKGTTIIFRASSPLYGEELYISDGTGAGTTLLKDIRVGGQGSSPSYLTNIAGTIYFSANDGDHGYEIWKTDGTPGGTVLVKDINPGPASSNPQSFISFQSKVYFTASDDTNGRELWLSDGTGAGTSLAVDINPGSGSSSPSYLTVANTVLTFNAYEPTKGSELYKWDGTTPTVFDLYAGAGNSSYPSYLTYNGTLVVFSAYTATTGYEIWTYNPTNNATQNFDFIGGATGLNPQQLTLAGTTVFFNAYHATYGAELWKFSAGAVSIVQDFVLGTGSSYPGSIVPSHPTASSASGVYFQAYNGSYYGLYYSSGGLTHTQLSPASAFNVYQIKAYGANVAIVSGYTAAAGYELYKTGIAASSVSLINDIYPGANSSYPYNFAYTGTMYFSANDQAKGNELFSTDLTTVSFVKDINTATDSNVGGLTATGSGFLFSANNGSAGQELWKTDLTTANTALFADVNVTAGAGSDPVYLGKLGANYLFALTDATNGSELWKTDGTTAPTLVKDIEPGINGSYPQSAAVLGSYMYFRAYTSANGYEVWKTDGTTGGTTIIDIIPGTAYSYPDYITAVGNSIVFSAYTDNVTYDYEMYKIDGTSFAVSLVKNINSTGSSYPYSYVKVGSQVFFVADDGVNGYELWVTDGTTANTKNVKDINPSGPSNPNSLTAAGSLLYFQATDGVTGTELWKTDGTSVNTVLVKDIDGAATSSYPYNLTYVGNTLYFNAYQPSTGTELWKSDGTTAGTVIVQDLTAGTASSSMQSLKDINGTLYFNAELGSGAKLYKTNGLAGGTFVTTSTGTAYDYPQNITYYNGKILFTANTNSNGNEPLLLMAEPLAQPTSLTSTGKTGNSLSFAFTAATGSPTGYIVLRKAGSAPSDFPADGTVYAVGNAIGTSTVAAIGTGTTFTDSGLSGLTTYYYAVYSYNFDGTTNIYKINSGLQGSATTISAEPSTQPTALTFTNISSSGFTVSYTAASGSPAGYVVIRKNGSSPTGVPTDGTPLTLGAALGDGIVAYVGAAVTFNETLASAPYFYDVYAFNGSGATINYLTVAPLEGNITYDLTAPVITNETVTSVSSGGTLDIIASVVENESQITGVTVDYKSVASSSAVTSSPLVLTSGKWKFTVPASQNGELGIEYKITATNNQSLSSNVSGKAAVTFSDQGPTLAFSSFGSAATNYRIISVPLELTSKSVNDVFVDDLGAYNKSTWRMFRYEGGSTKELTTSSTIDLGKGYWLIVKDNKPIDIGTGNTAAVSSTEPFTISLVSGWNQIGNPYNFNVLWSDVQAASGLTSKLRTYGAGGFVDGTKLNTFEGGFVFSSGAATLKFPVVKNPAAGRVKEPIASQNLNSLDQSDWEVNFSLHNGNVSNQFGGIGMSNDAKVDYDRYDDFTLPRFLDYLELNHKKDFLKNAYTKDVVRTAENHIWEFAIESNLSGVTEIHWDNSYFGNNAKNIFLYDVEAQAAIDMKEKNTYAFESTASRQFKVVYGSEVFVKDNALPEGLVINNVYPNPSESSVTIGITVPNYSSAVQTVVKVNSLLGQQVSHVFEGNLAPGYHELRWSGTDALGQRPVQGLYLVEVTTGASTKVKRLVLK